MQIATHTDLLNALIEKYNLKSYLEIGINDPNANFFKIGPPKDNKPFTMEFSGFQKVGVDPSTGKIADCFQITSDDFFAMLGTGKFDLIFIDGLHHADQVKRDFENSLRCLSDNGFIVIHDVLPENEAGTKVPRETKIWWGDVYKFAMNIGSYDEIGFKTFDIDNGCMLVWKDPGFLVTFTRFEDTWKAYKKHGHNAMNVTSTVEI